MRISTIRIGTILVLSLFAFTNINCGTAKKTVDPNAPRSIKEFSAQGESSSKQTGHELGKIAVEAPCPGDYPILLECKKWWAEGGTAGKDPFLAKGPDRASKRQTENSCVCDARHAAKSKDFFGISNHYIKCGVTAVCANK